MQAYKRKVISKYNFIQQELAATNDILEKAKSEIDEKVGAFLKGEDEDLSSHFKQVDDELELFHNKLCVIQEAMEDGRLTVNIACSFSGKKQKVSQDTQRGTSGSSRNGGNFEQVESLSSSSSQNDSISNGRNVFHQQLASQHYSRSEKKINTELGACAAEPNIVAPGHNESQLPHTALPSNFSSLQDNNIKTSNISIKDVKNSENAKNNSFVGPVSSSDGSSVYGTVSSVCSEVHMVDKSDILSSKDCVKLFHGSTNSSKQNIDYCHQVMSPEASIQNSVEDVLRTCPSRYSGDTGIPVPDLKIGSYVSATIQDITSPSDFWIQIDSIYMKELCPVANPVEQYDSLLAVKKNIYCLAPFKHQGEYFRAKVLELSEKIPGKQRAKLLYVDLGCKGSLCASTLKVLPASLQRIPAIAIQCALHGVVPVNGKWSYKAVEEFRKTLEVSDIKISISSRAGDIYFVQVSMTAGIPEDEKFTYDMAQFMCEFNFAVKESNLLSVQQHALLAPESCASVASSSSSKSTAKLPNPPSRTNDLSSMNSGENFMPPKSESSLSNTSYDLDAQNYDCHYQVHTNREPERSLDTNSEGGRSFTANKEGDRRTAIDKFVVQNAQGNVTSTSNHQKGTEKNSCRNVIESDSHANNGQSPHESKNLLSSSVLSSTDPCSTNHNTKVPIQNLPCVTDDSCNMYNIFSSQSSSDNFDWNVKIPMPSQKLERKAKFIVMLSAIVNPSDFYVNFAMPTSNELDELQEHMLSAYQNFDTSAMELPPLDKICGMFCCCQFTEDKNWYRVQVLELCSPLESADNSGTRVHIQYIDYGNEAEVQVEDLLPLKKEFATHPPFSFHCSLAGIKPKLSESLGENGENKWDEEAISRFRCLASFDKCYTAEIAYSVIYDARKSPIPIYLWDTVSSKDILINIILVEQGAANGADLELLNCPAEGNMQDIDRWDPMSADYNSTLNSYGVNLNDPEIAAVGHKANDEAYICKYFSTGKCSKGDRCSYQHIYGFSDSTMDKEPVEFLGESITLPAVNSIVFVSVSAMYNPGHFFVVFPYGTKSVELIYSEIRRCTLKKEDDFITEFLDNLNKYYNRNPYRKENTAVAPAIGTLVAVKWTVDNRWYRGRICDVFGTDAPLIIYFLDFGNSEVIEQADIYELDTRFRNFPFQAVECHLHGVEPKASEDGKWNSESREKFKKLTEGKTLIAHIKNIYGSSLHVELFDCDKDEECSVNDYLVHNGFGQPMQEVDCTTNSSSHNNQIDKQNKNVVYIPA